MRAERRGGRIPAVLHIGPVYRSRIVYWPTNTGKTQTQTRTQTQTDLNMASDQLAGVQQASRTAVAQLSLSLIDLGGACIRATRAPVAGGMYASRDAGVPFIHRDSLLSGIFAWTTCRACRFPTTATLAPNLTAQPSILRLPTVSSTDSRVVRPCSRILRMSSRLVWTSVPSPVIPGLHYRR